MKKLLVSALALGVIGVINAADDDLFKQLEQLEAQEEMTEGIEELGLGDLRVEAQQKEQARMFMDEAEKARFKAQALKNKRDQLFQDLRKRYNQLKKMPDSQQKTEDMRAFLNDLKVQKMRFIDSGHTNWAAGILRTNKRKYGIR